MQTNLEEMTNNYNLACVEAVRDTIHKLATKWGAEEVDLLNAGKYKIFIRLYGDTLITHAFIAKNPYNMMAHYDNPEMQADVQAAFDRLPTQVILCAMIHYGWEEVDQAIDWRIY